MTEKLKPCPFCGGEPYISLDEDASGNMIFEAIICRKCELEHYGGVKEWNTRHTPEGYVMVPVGLLDDLIETLEIHGEYDNRSVLEAKAMITA